MSKFTEALQLNPGGKVLGQHAFPTYYEISERIGPLSIPMFTSYELGAKFSVKLVAGDDAERSGHLYELETNAKNAMVEELFGEFRRPILDAIVEISRENPRNAIEMLNKVLDDMFKV